MLKVVELEKSFGENKVLDKISFEVNKGETAVVLGKSGAGKTTLMRCINGLEEFDSGSLVLDGKKVSSKEDRKKIRGQIGMVFQSFNLFPHLSVLENLIEAPVKVFKEDKEVATKRALELLEMMDILDKKDNYPCELSGGQKQRVAIARSCALKPKLLCFDEPTSALDPENIDKVVDIIEKLKKEDMAILIITHDIGFSKRVADKTIYI